MLVEQRENPCTNCVPRQRPHLAISYRILTQGFEKLGLKLQIQNSRADTF